MQLPIVSEKGLVMGEASVEQQPARVEINSNEVRELVTVSQNASVIDMHDVEVDQVTLGASRVFVNRRLRMMQLRHVVTSGGSVSLVTLDDAFYTVVIDVRGSQWIPRPIAYSYTLGDEDDVPSIKHFL